MPVPNSIDELSITPTGNFPVGTEQVFPNLDNYMRAMAAFVAQLRDRLNSEGVQLAATQWWGGARSALPERLAGQDGQLWVRSDYPALWAFVSSGGYPLTTEADWQANPLRRGHFSSGNGSTTFRMPDLNGLQSNSIGAVSVRGDGPFSAGAPGLMQNSQNESHSHGASSNQTGAHGHEVTGSTGGSGQHTHGNRRGDFGGYGRYSMRQSESNSAGFEESEAAGQHSHSVGGTASSAGSHAHDISIQGSGGNEARGKVATGAWIMRVK